MLFVLWLRFLALCWFFYSLVAPYFIAFLEPTLVRIPNHALQFPNLDKPVGTKWNFQIRETKSTLNQKLIKSSLTMCKKISILDTNKTEQWNGGFFNSFGGARCQPCSPAAAGDHTIVAAEWHRFATAESCSSSIRPPWRWQFSSFWTATPPAIYQGCGYDLSTSVSWDHF